MKSIVLVLDDNPDALFQSLFVSAAWPGHQVTCRKQLGTDCWFSACAWGAAQPRAGAREWNERSEGQDLDDRRAQDDDENHGQEDRDHRHGKLGR